MLVNCFYTQVGPYDITGGMMIYRAVYMYSYFDFPRTKYGVFRLGSSLGHPKLAKSRCLLLLVVAMEDRFRVKSL